MSEVVIVVILDTFTFKGKTFAKNILLTLWDDLYGLTI